MEDMILCPVMDFSCPYCKRVNGEIVCRMWDIDHCDPQEECDAFWWDDEEEEA